jgi:uncharacterized membrane protein YagU involved in acid resistance
MQPKPSNLFTTILLVGFLVGMLDISAAFIQMKIMFPERDPLGVLRYIASAVFGKERANSESSMYFIGAIFHFIIAYCFTVTFFLIYPHVRFLSKSRLLTGIFYGLIIWTVMNILVVPQTKIGQRPFVLKNAAIATGILIVAIGIPLSYFAYSFYYGKRTETKQQAALID